MKIKKYFEENKNRLTILLLALSGIVLIVASTMFGRDEEDAVTEYTEIGFYTAYLEERITDLCNSLYGVSDTQVFLTLDCSSEQIYQNDSASDFLILTGDDGDMAVKLCEIYPKVRGIAVVCRGGDIPRIQATVTDLLAAALGLPKNQIQVAGSS
ncbi:MAG: hypothetical protein E7628_01185 [Ruminococcaceae bacterium]|nr:hypothetical protein [Oscillospiraceae bacterium]